MSSVLLIFALLKLVTFAIIILLSLVYSLLILIISRFHHRSNILTFNLSLAFISCCIYWFIFCISWEYDHDQLFIARQCVLQIYIQTMCTCQLAFAFVVIPINRVVSIIHSTKLFFKSKQWLILCIVSQWIAGLIAPIPLLPRQNRQCIRSLWTGIYRVIIIIAIPSLISFFVNLIIFIYVRSSYRRVQCSSQIITTHPTSEVSQVRVCRHDIHLIRYMVYTFCVFIGGWSPIFLLMAIDFRTEVSPLVYVILIVWAEASLLSIIINLFRYNQKLRHYLKQKILRIKSYILE